METYLLDWLNLLVRWIHMIVGIAWIGASFYFIWLENNLNRSNPREGLSGDLWAIHGGGIYHLEKYKLQMAAYSIAHEWMYPGETFEQGVLFFSMRPSPQFNKRARSQVIVVEQDELAHYQQKWVKVLEDYYA